MARPELPLKYSSLKGLNDERKVVQFGGFSPLVESQRMTISGEIPGTMPEKIIYDMLKRLKVNFQFQYYMPENMETMMKESNKIPDFILPDYNIIIEVYGTYWHTKNIEEDQIKQMYYLQAGYTIIQRGIPIYPTEKNNGGKVIIWWEDEIYYGLDHLFARDIPELDKNHIRGSAAAELRDIPKEFIKLDTMRARLSKPKLRPRPFPQKTRVYKVRKQPTRMPKPPEA